MRVEELTKEFGSITALRDLTFSVNEGELFGLVGPDGAGKTTTLRVLAGVLTPTKGDALLNGRSVVRDAEGVKDFIAYMPQRFGLYEDLTVAENLGFYADLFQVPRNLRPARLERLYAFSHLGEFKERLAGALSGGMKQKLSLSCALIHQPNILLLDEPTFGVDPISRRELWLIVLEMVAEGVTVLASTSYMEEAERFDRVALLHEGEILALDSPAALERRLDGHLFQITSPKGGDLRPLRDRLRRTAQVAGATLFGSRIHVLLENPDRTILDQVLPSSIRAHEIPAGLEDVFLHTVSTAQASKAPLRSGLG